MSSEPHQCPQHRISTRKHYAQYSHGARSPFPEPHQYPPCSHRNMAPLPHQEGTRACPVPVTHRSRSPPSILLRRSSASPLPPDAARSAPSRPHPAPPAPLSRCGPASPHAAILPRPPALLPAPPYTAILHPPCSSVRGTGAAILLYVRPAGRRHLACRRAGFAVNRSGAEPVSGAR